MIRISVVTLSYAFSIRMIFSPEIVSFSLIFFFVPSRISFFKIRFLIYIIIKKIRLFFSLIQYNYTRKKNHYSYLLLPLPENLVHNKYILKGVRPKKKKKLRIFYPILKKLIAWIGFIAVQKKKNEKWREETSC